MRQPKDIIIGSYTLEEILKRHDCWTRECVDYPDQVELHYANLFNVDLSGANLIDLDFHHANLYGADLRYADLRNANLSRADLRNADLSGANLSNANLSYTNFYNANLRDAYLADANLHNTIFQRTNLTGTRLDNANGNFIEYRKGKILTQNIIGYKKCLEDHGTVIVTLEIPRGAIVFSINGHKFRTNKAKVIGLDGVDKARSYYQYMTYYMGDEFTIYNFNCEYNIECGAGIHFFMTREEAENYEFF